MGIADAYVTAMEYSQTKGPVKDAATLERQLLMASRFIDGEAGWFFGRDAAPVARRFLADYSDVLWLDYELCPGIADTDGLVVKVDTDSDGSFADESAWAATDYELLPRQAQVGPEPRPFNRLSAPLWSNKSFRPGALVEVTAAWGWPEVPPAIKELTIELTELWRGSGPRATSQINELNEVVQASPMHQGMLSRVKAVYGRKPGLG